MNPEDYNFYRIDIGNEHVRRVMPTRLTYKRFLELVPSIRNRAKVLSGFKVRGKYGIYWIEKKSDE